MSKRGQLDDQKRQEIKRLRKEGKTYDQISEAVGLHQSTIGRALQEEGLTTKKDYPEIGGQECKRCEHKEVCMYKKRYHELPNWAKCAHYKELYKQTG